LNASLNGVSAILLAGGYAAIRSGKIAVHKAFMISAFCVLSVFRVPASSFPSPSAAPANDSRA
jgi:uncharacterized membrane protein YozB (DUF420 family)